jgi:quercetin dioxygenase-like cupin family protein
MKSNVRWLIAIGVLGLAVLIFRAQTQHDVVAAETRNPVHMTRLYTGPDGLTHAEEIEVTLTGNGLNDVSEMYKVTGAEIHRAAAGTTNNWHPAPRRQFVITLSGRGEIEVSGGKKIPVEPGDIEFAEDLTGKGHITRVVGSEDRVTIQIPLADQTARVGN